MNLITRRESQRYPGLFVKKYTKKVFWDNLWHEDEELLESRGHVELADGTPIITPFSKVFNYGENNTTIDPEETCLCVRKVNGFMACATYVPFVDDVVVSTTGSLDSAYVAIAESHLRGKATEWIKWIYGIEGVAKTFMFEICDYTDPHIVPEDHGAYLIGQREVSSTDPYYSDWQNELALDVAAQYMGVRRPEWIVGRSFAEVVEMSKTCQHEGYVVYGMNSGTVLKIKSPYYLCLKAVARKKDILSLDKSRVDEEYYDLIDHLKTVENFNDLAEQDRLEYIRKWLQEN